jgi:hypothetical protein
LEQVGVLSQQYGDRVAFGKVEVKNAPKMMEYFNIKDLPALKYFRYHHSNCHNPVSDKTLMFYF